MPESYDALDAELRALATGLLPPASTSGEEWVEELAGAVLVRVAAEPVPGRPSSLGAALRRAGGWVRARWRALVAVLTAVVVVGSLAPPVRASVAELFGFSGVVVRREPDLPPPTGTPSPPPAVSGLTLDQARGMIAFEPLLSGSLGAPDGVEVSGDRIVLSLTWTSGGRTLRLDEFGAGLEPRFWKTVRDAEFVQVGNANGLWIPAAHEVVVLDGDGNQRREPPRLAGPTLILEREGTTVRLEGARTLHEALDLAGSLR